MKELILVIVGAALVNNIILSQFQGLCPFLGVSKKVDTSLGMGAAVIFVIVLASVPVSGAGRVPASDYHQLRSSGFRSDQRTEGVQLYFQRGQRFWYCSRLYHCNCTAGKYP